MSLRVAIQMDPVESIDIRGDTSFALGLEAQNRGHELHYYLPGNLTLVDGRPEAVCRTLALRDKVGDHFTAGEPVRRDLSAFDVILMRQDPPFDMAYILSLIHI